MADKKITELTAYTTPIDTDVVPIVDVTSSQTKKFSWANLKARLQADLGLSGTNTGDNATNSQYAGLVSNATHTGEVTGSTALALDKTSITNKTEVTAVGTDYVLISDTSDSGNLKKVLASDLTASYAPLLYAYLPDYKPQTEIDALAAGEIATNGKFWAVMWENFRFCDVANDPTPGLAVGDHYLVDTTISGASNMGYSAGNKTKALSIADNLICGVAGDLDGGVAAMMANGTKRAAAVAAIVSHVDTNGFIGVNINFEPVPSLTGTVLTNFRTFISDLRTALDAVDTSLIITWAGQISWDSDQPNKEYSSVNYTGESNMSGTNLLSYTLSDLNTIGFDIIEMQAYDQFYDFGFTEFGITSPDQVANAINFAQSRISKDKHALIIGTYGVQMNSGTDVYGTQGSQTAIEGNNLNRAEITAKSATFYTAGTRQNNQYLLQTVDTSVGTATMTIASPCVVTKASHGLEIGDTITFTTTGALPTGLTASTTYYVISAGFTANTFRLSATLGGSAINTSGSQSGTHTLKRRTNIMAPDQQTIDTYYAICKNRQVKYIGFWLAGDYYYPSVR